MNDQKAGNFFGACLEIMSEGFAGANDELASIEAQAKAFLTSIGYLASTGEERRHCRALLALAERFSDTSIFPNKRAPGATFFAGIIEPKSFGVRGHGDILQSPSGRGLNLKGAFESCLGEAAEYLSFIEHDEDPLIQSTEQSAGLDEAELAWACAGVGIEADAMKIDSKDWVEATSLSDGSKAFFPSELVLRRPSPKTSQRRQAESNGVGAGRSLDEAIKSALMEVIESDAIALWWYAGQPATKISDQFIRSNGVDSLINKVRGNVERRHWFLDLTNDLGVPVAASLSSNPDGSEVVGGFASRETLVEAMESAFLENCQMELAQDLTLMKLTHLSEAQLKPQDMTWLTRMRRMSIANFPELMGVAFSSDFGRQKDTSSNCSIFGRLAGKGITPYFVDLTRTGINVPVARVLIPGLQSVKPGWVSPRLVKQARKYVCGGAKLVHGSGGIVLSRAA